MLDQSCNSNSNSNNDNSSNNNSSNNNVQKLHTKFTAIVAAAAIVLGYLQKRSFMNSFGSHIFYKEYIHLVCYCIDLCRGS